MLSFLYEVFPYQGFSLILFFNEVFPYQGFPSRERFYFFLSHGRTSSRHWFADQFHNLIYRSETHSRSRRIVERSVIEHLNKKFTFIRKPEKTKHAFLKKPS